MNFLRKIFFLCISLFAIFLILVALEFILQGTGMFREPPASLLQEWSQNYRQVPDSRIMERYFESYEDESGILWVRTNRDLVQGNILNDEKFINKPDKNIFRIFCFGESTTFGIPFEHEPELKFSSRLGYYLELEGLHPEVINAGGCGFFSNHVVEILREASSYSPSAFVVYLGNNEFRQYSLELFAKNQELIRYRHYLMRFYLFRALSYFYRQVSGTQEQKIDLKEFQDPPTMFMRQKAVVESVLERSFREQGRSSFPVQDSSGIYERRDIPYIEVLKNFEHNLQMMKNICRQADPPISLYLVDVPVNLLEPPFSSLHIMDMGVMDGIKWEETYSRARDLEDSKNWEDAEREYSKAINLDTYFAESYYHRGIVRCSAENFAGSYIDLVNALELDMLPGRCVFSLRNIIRKEAASGNGVWLVKLNMPEGGNFDPEYYKKFFHDWCHPSKLGQDYVAECIATSIMMNANL